MDQTQQLYMMHFVSSVRKGQDLCMFEFAHIIMRVLSAFAHYNSIFVLLHATDSQPHGLLM